MARQPGVVDVAGAVTDGAGGPSLRAISATTRDGPGRRVFFASRPLGKAGTGRRGRRVHFDAMTRRPLSALPLAVALFAPVVVAAAEPARTLCSAEPPALRESPACARDFGVDEREATVQSLLAIYKTRVDATRYDDAERVLDCAEAALAQSGAPADRRALAHARAAIAYKRDRIPEALGQFECALRFARDTGDGKAVATELNGIGSALRRMGDYRGALERLVESLDLQRARGEVGGAVLSNLGDVYRESGDAAHAMGYYRQALEAFRDRDNVQAGHVLTTMAGLAKAQDDLPRAQSLLEEALATFRREGNPRYEPLAQARLAEIAFDRGDVAHGRAIVRAGLAVATTHRLPLPANLQLQAARGDRLAGDFGGARARLRGSLESLAKEDTLRPDLLRELSLVERDAGDLRAALDWAERARISERELARKRHDEQLGWVRTRFDTAEIERRNAALEASNRQRTLQLWATVVSALAVVLAFWLLLQRRRQRERLQLAAERVRHEEEIARYRRETDALAEDRQVLQVLLDSRTDAVCLLDADGQVLAANLAARTLFGAPEHMVAGRSFADCVDPADREAFGLALERMEDAASQPIVFACAHGGARCMARLAQWERGDGLIIVSLQPADPRGDAEPSVVPARGPEDNGGRDGFRRALVALMLASVDAWERTTGTTRLEFAEKSRIWRVTVDDGRLRIRAMERYLSTAKLPQNPRWRDVLRSAYYVLGHCALAKDEREALQARVDEVLAYTRRSALV